MKKNKFKITITPNDFMADISLIIETELTQMEIYNLLKMLENKDSAKELIVNLCQ